LLRDVETEPHADNDICGCTVRSNRIGAVDFSLTAAERDLVELAREFSQKEIAPRAPIAWDEARCPTDLLREMGELGLLGMLIPEEWGGIGMSTVGFVAAIEQIGLADQSVAAALQAHVTIGSLPLYLFGNDAQRNRWLRPLAEGRALGAFGLTEPEAGSDTRGIKTRAERYADGWRINGQKTFISNAGTDMSFGVTVLARTESADEKAKFGSFVVEKDTPGFTMGPKMRGIGWRGLDTRALYFDDVCVPDDHLVGDPDLGLGQFLATLEVGRISIAALSLSLTQAVLDLSVEHAQRRVQFGQPISTYQAVQFKLADIATELEAARWLTYRAAYLRDIGEPFLKEASMAKLKASRVAVAAASEAVQIHGGIGYMLETPVARFYCDSKVLEIGEGTNEIQHMVIARALGC
jgi:short-chain 2-methylacyl-CoA dehydrogenase